MADMYDYNGNKLPALRELPEGCEYAAIYYDADDAGYVLFYSSERITYQNGQLLIPAATAAYGGYGYRDGGTEWAYTVTFTPEGNTENPDYYAIGSEPLWTNQDILNEDTVVLAASTPLQYPTITGISSSRTYTLGEEAEALVCEATVSDGELSYRWYRGDNVVSETSSYTPPVNAVGSESYYCIVTNSISGKQLTTTSQTVTVTVEEAKITILDPTSMLMGWLVGERIKGMLRRRVEPVVYPENCLTFASTEPFTIGVNNATKNWDGTLYYSTDNATWNEWDGATAIASANHGGEQRVYMRGSGNTRITNGVTTKWNLIGSDIRCTGNIENLLDYATVEKGEHPVMDSYCFACLFYTNTGLITAPALPAITLSANCYYYMFYGCVNLTTLPALPATELPDKCYYQMFDGCKKIKMSETQTEEYTTPYRIPVNGTGTAGQFSLYRMFADTGGTYTDVAIGSNMAVNTTYYTSNETVPAGKLVGYKYGISDVLPDIESVWDKSTYPYAGIHTSLYLLIVSDLPLRRDANKTEIGSYVFEDVVSDGVRYKLDDSGENWVRDAGGNSKCPTTCAPLWVNYDMYNTDGTLLREASEPIPVYE